MHKRERYFAMLNAHRVVRPFEWGTEFISDHPNGDDPRKLFVDYSKKTIADSESFYFDPGTPEYEKNGNVITWRSAVTTPSVENNTVYATYFPHATNRRSAVLVLPHWNAKAGTYFDLCRFFNKVGLSSLRQSVVDTRSAVAWLKQQGYEKVGIVGTSIGSCVGFFAFVHDMRIDAAVFNHVSGYVADVVWEGLSTHHVREGIGDNVELDELREYWLPISPLAYMDKLAALHTRPQRYIYTLYDLSFPVDLSREVIRELRRRHIKHSEVKMPCGHYTLGEKPWVYLDGYKIISFLRKHLK